MTIGYGVGVGSAVAPFAFYVDRDCHMEAGFFKLFLFEKPVNLQGIQQKESIFTRSRTLIQTPLPPLGTSTDGWGSIIIPVIQRRIEPST